jgi:hypothetical protein
VCVNDACTRESVDAVISSQRRNSDSIFSAPLFSFLLFS